MELKNLKKDILDNKLKESFYIFNISDNDFLAAQYSKAISKILGKEIEPIEEIDSLLNPKKILFEDSFNTIKLFKCNSFAIVNDRLNNIKDLIIITSNISEDAKLKFSYNIVNIPPLEKWQIKDYAYSLGDGLDPKDIDLLLNICNYDIFRVDQELSKLEGFSSTQRKFIFKQMIKEGALEDIARYNIFDLINKLQSKDKEALRDIIRNIDSMGVEPTLLFNLLYQSFRKLLLVWLDKNPTPESTGLKSNQIWAIKNIPHNYTKEQLVEIFKFITSIDYRLKLGEFSDINLSDYIISKILLI